MATGNTKIQRLIDNRQVREAFSEASKDVLTDKTSQTYFLQILRVRNNVALLQEDMDSIRKAADKGNPYMQLAYARLHECLMPEPDSLKTHIKYFQSAMKAGIPDARAYLAASYRDGDFGEVDLGKYHDNLQLAMDEGSEKALQQILRDKIFGNFGVEADPRKVSDDITEYIDRCKADGTIIDPAFYYLMASADEKLGRTGSAMDEYETAYDKGHLPALLALAVINCCDENGNIVDKTEFEKILDRGRECGCADSFLTYPLLVDDELYESCTEDEKAHINKHLAEDLETAGRLGDDFGPYYLATYYEDGTMGFEQDFSKAFSLYARGALLRNTSCYEAMVRMILDDHTAPAEYDEKFAYNAAYLCLMLGGDTLGEVIRGYRKGFLTEHAAAIEQVYLPQYTQIMEDIMDEHDIDDDDEPIIDDPDSFHAAEREVEEDDWAMDPDIDLSMQTCAECSERVRHLMQEQDHLWEVAGIARKFITAAQHVMSDNDSLIDQLYECSHTITDGLSDHPRLKLLLMQLQLEMLQKVEAASQHELIISDDLKKEIARYERNIALADEGRLSEIPQSGFLKRDPIEWTKKWEDVVDEAEKIACSHLEDMPRGMGFCFAYWPERKAALAKLGVEWRDPHQMNPRVMFD